MARMLTALLLGAEVVHQISDTSVPPVTTGAAAKAIGNVHPTSAERKSAPVAVEAFGALRFVLVQICVPSANRTNSPFVLLPRSRIAPVGIPADWVTGPSTVDWLNTSDHVSHVPPTDLRCQVRVA